MIGCGSCKRGGGGRREVRKEETGNRKNKVKENYRGNHFLFICSLVDLDFKWAMKKGKKIIIKQKTM